MQRAKRSSGLAATGVATVAAMAFTTAGSTAVETQAAPASDRLAIILPGSREDETLGKPARALGTGRRSAELIYDLETASLFLEDDDGAAENVAQQVDADSARSPLRGREGSGESEPATTASTRRRTYSA